MRFDHAAKLQVRFKVVYILSLKNVKMDKNYDFIIKI
jgi:hypothetical protein